jgi:hypothetical protein
MTFVPSALGVRGRWLGDLFTNQRVRRRACHRLPFVAEGAIPLIDRRASFMHRATPQ